MKRKLFAAFMSGACLSGLAFGFALQHTERLVQGAWLVREDQGSATIRFNHDATDQVVCVRVPIPDFPTSKGHQSAARTTVDIWSESDSVTEELMLTDAYGLEKRAIQDILGWQMGK